MRSRFHDVRPRKQKIYSSSNIVVAKRVNSTRKVKTSSNSPVPRFVLVFIFGCLFSAGGYYVLASANEPLTIPVEISSGLTRMGVSMAFGKTLGWTEEQINSFGITYAELQWAAFNKELATIFKDKYNLNQNEVEIFLTNSTSYLEPQYDFLTELYVPGSYSVSLNSTEAEIGEMLINKISDINKISLISFISDHLSDEQMQKTREFIAKNKVTNSNLSASVANAFISENKPHDEGEDSSVVKTKTISKIDEEKIKNSLAKDVNELLPDLVPLPARDIHIKKTSTSTILTFSTIYYNQGDGPLELQADPKTIGQRKDSERNVFQRIFRSDGSHRDLIVGNFLWHQTHLHYHFADFVTYDIEAIDAPGAPDLSGLLTKSTFCIRDVSKVDLELENTPKDADYKICGQRKQGISVGWGDTYLYTYPDQSLNISELTSGVYKLTFNVNPSQFLKETDLTNNKSSVLINIDMKKGTVKVLEEDPVGAPAVKHVYTDQVFDN